MQQAAIPGYKISRSKTSTKVLITLGLLGMFLGLLGAVALTVTRTGIRPQSVVEYYLGTSSSAGNLDAMTQPEVKRSFDELAEVTHLHLMGGTLLLFLLCHILSVCELSEKTRTVLYIVSFGSFLSTFSLPWLIVYGSPIFAYAYGPSIVVLIISLFLLIGIPCREMWLGVKS